MTTRHVSSQQTMEYARLMQGAIHHLHFLESGMTSIPIFPMIEGNPHMTTKYAAWPPSAANDLRLALYALFGGSDELVARGVLEAEARTALRYTNGTGGPGLAMTNTADVVRVIQTPGLYGKGMKLQKARPRTLADMLEEDEVIRQMLAERGADSLADLAKAAPNPPQLLN